MNRSTLALLTLCLVLSAPAVAQSYYKWRDDQGTVHFTSEPPPDRDYEIVNTSGQVIGNSETTAALLERMEARREAEAEAEDSRMPREGEPDPERVDQRCREARENLMWLRSNRQIVIEGEDGSKQYIDNERKQELLAENEAFLKDWCQDQPDPGQNPG